MSRRQWSLLSVEDLHQVLIGLPFSGKKGACITLLQIVLGGSYLSCVHALSVMKKMCRVRSHAASAAALRTLYSCNGHAPQV